MSFYRRTHLYLRSVQVPLRCERPLRQAQGKLRERRIPAILSLLAQNRWRPFTHLHDLLTQITCGASVIQGDINSYVTEARHSFLFI